MVLPPFRLRTRISVTSIVLLVLILSSFALTAYQWANTDGPVRSEGAPEEQILNYMAGRNFVTHGFLSRGFITDYSIDPDTNSPPLYYTHFPPLPSIIIGALELLGVEGLPNVRMVMNVIFAIGLAFVALFFKKHLSSWHAIGVVLFLGFNFRTVLSNSDHVTYAYWFGLTFLALWSLTIREKPSRYLWFGMLSLFLISWINYIQVVFTASTMILLWAMRLPNFTWKRLVIGGIVLGIGLFAHLLQNIIVLGWDIAVQDMLSTLGNRIFGVPGRAELLQFAQENDLVLWGVSELAPIESRFSWIFNELRLHMIQILIALSGIGLLAYFRRSKTLVPSIKLVLVFTISSISWYFIFQAHGQAAPLPMTIALPIAMVSGFFIGELAPCIADQFSELSQRRAINRGFRKFIPSGLMIILASIVIWQGFTLSIVSTTDSRSLYSPATVGELEILEEYKGEGFWTNVTPHLVGYYTEDWVVGQMPLEAVKNGDVSQAFVTTLAKDSSTWDVASVPHYFFLSVNNVVLNIDDRGEVLEEYRTYFENNYPVLAWSEYGSSVIDLSWGSFGTSHLVRGEHTVVPHIGVNIPINENQIEASSSISDEFNVSNLVKPSNDGFWMKSEEDQLASIVIDIGYQESISTILFLPGQGPSDQLPKGNSTFLQGSNNGSDWQPLAILGIDNNIDSNGWITFEVNIAPSYQFYKLSFRDPGFNTLTRIELFTYGQS